MKWTPILIGLKWGLISFLLSLFPKTMAKISSIAWWKRLLWYLGVVLVMILSVELLENSGVFSILPIAIYLGVSLSIVRRKPVPEPKN